MSRLCSIVIIATLALCSVACGSKDKSKATVAQPASSASAQIGAASPSVDVVAFVGFQCPHCKTAAAGLLELAEKHKDVVRVTVVNLPLDAHKDSVALAKGFIAAHKMGKWQSYWKHMFNAAQVNASEVQTWAKAAGVDMKVFQAALEHPATAAQVARDAGLADTLGVAGTPSYLVNGALLQGAQKAEAWEKIVANQRKLAGAKFSKLKGVELLKALATHNSPKRAPLYIAHVIEGKEAPVAKVPVVVARKSGVVSAKLMPAGGGGRAAIRLGGKPSASDADPNTVWRVAVRADDPTRGAADAPLTLVVFSDYECKFCKGFQTTLAQLSKRYGKDLRVVHKHNPLPFHSNALAAAEAAEAARAQGKFWQMHDALFASAPALSQADLDKAATSVGLDMSAYRNAMSSHGARERIQADAELAAASGARGTPNIFVNGVKVVGAKDVEQLAPLLDAQLAKAKGLIAQGVAANAIYGKLTGEGKLLDSLSSASHKLVTQENQSRGPSGAVVHIVAFEDFECPYSARLGPHIRAMEREFPNRLKVSWVDFPMSKIHPHAQVAAEAGKEAASQGRFWAFHDAVMKSSRDGGSKLDEAGLLAIGKTAGLDSKKLKKALTTHKWAAAVKAEADQAAKLALKGTPSVFINGHAFKPQLGFSANTFRTAIRRLIGAQ